MRTDTIPNKANNEPNVIITVGCNPETRRTYKTKHKIFRNMVLRIMLLTLIISLGITSCCRNPLMEVKVGMTSEQLTEIAGEPDSVRDEFFNKVWYYETHLVTVENDTVRQIASKAEIKAEIMRMQQEYNKIKGFE